MLFTNDPIHLPMPDAQVIYYPDFYSTEKATDLFNTLLDNVPWQQDDIKIFGKSIPQPRLTALYANNQKTLSYSGLTMKPHAFINPLSEIKSKVEAETQHQFTSCLCNLYRNGQDSNGWHADIEKELGQNPVIASVSFGAERIFHFKHKDDPSLKQKIILKHGSLLLMAGKTQHYWLHQVPKTKKNIGKRINLTFRTIL